MDKLDEIRRGIRDDLTPDHKEKGKFICPICGSGTGAHKTGAFSIDKDGIHGHCFACGFHGDRFDLYAKRHNCDLSEATKALTMDYLAGRSSSTNRATVQRKQQEAPEEKPRRSYAQEITRYHSLLQGSAGEKYLMGRGFTPETMERFSLGYDESHYFSERGNCPAIVMPYNRAGTYIAWRAITDEHTNTYSKPASSEAGEEPVFNAAALYSGEPVFVVESQLCAISIEQEGGRAVAIGGTGKNKLLKLIDKKPPTGCIVLSLDNDKAGQDQSRELADALTTRGIHFIQANISGEAKDPNEALQRGTLKEGITEAIRNITAELEREQQERAELHQQESAAGYIKGFFEQIAANKAAPAIPTGFSTLDSILDGGLYPGLYIIGALTSLGKTTFTLQAADQIARAGHDVLFFSLEMSRMELIAKSISRYTFEISKREGMSQDKAKTTRGILSGRWGKYTADEMELMAAATDEYREQTAGRIWHFEGVGDIGVSQIREAVEKHISITGRSPVVIIDYLQILAPVDMRASDKQNTDKNVLELKRLSRDKGIPIIGISSLNRDNYTAPINAAAFKESGAIEYSSDVLIGLQFAGMDYDEGETDKAREKRIRELIKDQKEKGNAGGAETIELKILKNRNGKSGAAILFFYTPMFNHYEPMQDGFQRTNPADNPFSRTKPKKKPL